jgi:hypothetical protein
MKKKIKKEKDYRFNVDIGFYQSVPACSKKEAIAILKDTFYEEYGLELQDSEIKFESIQKGGKK